MRFSASVQTGLEALLASCTKGTSYLFPGIKQPERGSENVAEVKERVGLYFHSPLGHHALLQGELYLYLHHMT